MQALVWMRPCASVSGHALHAVGARSELHARIRALAHDSRDHPRGSRRARLAGRDDSTCQRWRSAKRVYMRSRSPANKADFVAAGAGTDFEEDVALVVRVPAAERWSALCRGVRYRPSRTSNLLLRHLLHLRVGQHLLRRGEIAFAGLELLEQRSHRFKIAALLRQRAKAVWSLTTAGSGKQASTSTRRRSSCSSLTRKVSFHGSQKESHATLPHPETGMTGER